MVLKLSPPEFLPHLHRQGKRNLAKRGSLVLTHRAQKPQMPPPLWGFSLPLPSEEKTKPNIHQGFGENRLCAWGIKRERPGSGNLTAGQVLLGRGLATRAVCSAWSILALTFLQRSLPPIQLQLQPQAPGLQESGDAFLELSF